MPMLKAIRNFITTGSKFMLNKFSPIIRDQALRFTKFLQKKGIDPNNNFLDDIVYKGLEKLDDITKDATTAKVVDDAVEAGKELVTEGEKLITKTIKSGTNELDSILEKYGHETLKGVIYIPDELELWNRTYQIYKQGRIPSVLQRYGGINFEPYSLADVKKIKKIYDEMLKKRISEADQETLDKLIEQQRIDKQWNSNRLKSKKPRKMNVAENLRKKPTGNLRNVAEKKPTGKIINVAEKIITKKPRRKIKPLI